LLRAVLEGISFEVRIILETMEQAFGYHFDVVNTIGGSARNLLWQELKANILGRPVELPDVEEATSKGAALLAGVGVGVYQDLSEASRRTHQIKTRLEPVPDLVERYNDIFPVYQQIYPALKAIPAMS
jgi:xylulokinase